mmetsp:Transcript_43295/g.122716  ORF Transcript_43295/g.122716 Transcript_43295/m.122716 type:complete len:144 (-) Transcript_43295:660-1091(-)
MFGSFHHAIYVSPDEVIHYARDDGSKHKAHVDTWTLERLLREYGATDVYLISYKHPTFTNGEIVERARSRIGKGEYNVFFNNCETFAYWCHTDKERSDQMRVVKENVKREVKKSVHSLADEIVRGGLPTRVIPIQKVLARLFR